MKETTESSTVAEKIRKLLALADGNQNDHERDAAMKLAMELLSKHNLDLTTVADRSNEIEVLECIVTLKLEPWIRAVLAAVCKLYYTEYLLRPVYKGYFHDRKEYHPTFIGTRENIDVTLEVASWLLSSIRSESNWLFTEQFERRSFRLGAAHKLHARACELIDEERKNGAPTSTNSLMVLRNDLQSANKKHLESKNLKTFRSRGSSFSSDAYGMGESFGDSVNLGRSGTKPKAITARNQKHFRTYTLSRTEPKAITKQTNNPRETGDFARVIRDRVDWAGKNDNKLDLWQICTPQEFILI